jgi:type VI secretion system secreted protein Hcp
MPSAVPTTASERARGGSGTAGPMAPPTNRRAGQQLLSRAIRSEEAVDASTVRLVAAQAFLRIDGIKGESTDAKHAGQIDVEAFSWGVSQPGSVAVGGGGGAGKASFSDFSFFTRSTTASPQLVWACASGKHLKEAVLTARQAGAAAVEFLKITFTDVQISSYQASGSDDVPGDSVSFNFAKIKFEFTQTGAKGTPGARASAGWDLKANKKF